MCIAFVVWMWHLDQLSAWCYAVPRTALCYNLVLLFYGKWLTDWLTGWMNEWMYEWTAFSGSKVVASGWPRRCRCGCRRWRSSAHCARRSLFDHFRGIRRRTSDSLSSGVTRVGDTRGGNWGCHPLIFLENLATFFLPVRPRFYTILCKFAHKKFSFVCHPTGGCHPGRSVPRPPSDATEPVHG